MVNTMKPLAEALGEAHPDLILEENQALSSYTTFKIGGSCPLMGKPSTEDEFLSCIRTSEALGIPSVILGNGSNLLVSDLGVSAFVIQTKEFSQISSLGGGKISAQAGVMLSKLAVFSAELALTGLEFAHGIPGTLGGGLMMNAGAYGGEMQDVVESVTSYVRSQQTCITRTVDELEFSYRHSRFSREDEVILSAVLQLQPGDMDSIRGKMQELAKQRREKQPLNYPSCGSTFRRPPQHFAAALIDQCGLKGLQVGGAQVSPKHAGFVVNVGDATCEDVLNLVKQIQETVLEQTGVTLELEVKLLS